MKKFFRFIFGAISLVGVLTYLAASCTPYIDPARFWPMTFLALGFPIIAACFLVICIIWLAINWRISLLFFAVFFIAGYTNLHSTFGVNLFSDFNYSKDKKTLRVMTWNVRYFDISNKAADHPGSIRRKMFGYIKKANPDVMMFQDYIDFYSEDNFSNISMIRDTLGYKYCYTTKDQVEKTSRMVVEHGLAIYSKFPIIDSGKTLFENGSESVGYADILFQNKPIRFLTTHLLSMSIHPGSQLMIGHEEYDDALRYGKNISKRLKSFDQYHVQQAIMVREQEAKSPYPIIVTGDFNSVPSSYVYHTIKGNLQDAFIKAGFKLGHTYVGISKTLRIDYILADKKFEVLHVTTPKMNLSDHFPVVTDLQWKQ